MTELLLTSLMSITGMSSSSPYSDSSSELLSSSDELVSVGVDGDLIDVKLLSSRKVFIFSVNGLIPGLIAFSLLTDGLVSFGGRIFLAEIRAGVNEPKRKVNKDDVNLRKRLRLFTYEISRSPERALFRSVISSGDIWGEYLLIQLSVQWGSEGKTLRKRTFQPKCNLQWLILPAKKGCIIKTWSS